MQTRFIESVDHAFRLFESFGGTFFRATFTRKDGTLRHMNARQHVRRHLAGGEMRYDPRPRSLLPVYDVQSAGYRMVNVATLQELVHGGVRYLPVY